MNESLTTPKPKSRYMVSCVPFRLTNYIIGVKNLQVEIDASYIKGMLNNLDIQPGTVVNRWIVGIKLFQFELVHVPGCLHTGPDGLSHCAASPNDLIDEDEDMDDWLDRTMSFAIVLMKSWPSWSSRLNSSYHLTQATLYWLISHWPSHQKLLPTYSIYLEDEGHEEAPTPVIPHSDLVQCTDDHLEAVRALLHDPLAPTNLSEPGIHGLVCYASKFFLLDSKLMRHDPQGHHKVVIPKEKHFFLITQAHERS